MTEYIDVEPTWVGVARMTASVSNQQNVRNLLKELEKACEIADKVRQAQKSGAKSIKFYWLENGETTFEVEIDSDKFTIDEEVNVTPHEDDEFNYFRGTIIAFRGKFISVIDQEDNVFDVHEWQLSKIED